MGRWKQTDNDLCEVDIGDGVSTWADTPDGAELFIQSHNADCYAYEAKIVELEAALTVMTEAAEEMEYVCGLHNNRIHEQEAKLARIAALVKPVPVADLVEAGTAAPALLAERHRRIRAILEDER